MKPIPILLAVAACITLVVRQNILSGVEKHEAASRRASSESEARTGMTISGASKSSPDKRASAAQPLSESNRIIAELVAEGVSPEYAAEVMASVHAAAAPHRTGRGLWPGATTNALWVSNRFVMFSNGPSLEFEP